MQASGKEANVPIDPKELVRIPETAASSRIKYVRYLDDDQIQAFFHGLFLTSVEAKDTGRWDKLSRYLEEWEEIAVDTLLLGRHAYESGPWAPLPKPLSLCKVAIVTTGGVYVDGDEPFDVKGDWSFRILPKDTPRDKFRIAHEKYDLTGVLDDINTVFPVDVLEELADDGIVGALAHTNYGFMGYIPQPEGLVSETAPAVARRLKEDGVEAVLIPTT